MSQVPTRKALQRAVQNAGLQLGRAPFDALLAFVSQDDTALLQLPGIIEALQVEFQETGQVTLHHVEVALQQSVGVEEQLDLAAVVSAFDVPKISYDPVSKKLFHNMQPRSILAAGEVSF